MLQKEQWLEVGAMELDHKDVESIEMSAIDVDQLLPEAKERINKKAILDEKYKELCKQVSSGGNINRSFSISTELVYWKNRIYVPEGL
jgi:phage FluMu protein gp41